MRIHMAELQSCTGFWEGSPTPVFNRNALPLGHTDVLIEITSIYGFHKGIYNLRYCFILIFSLKAQRISEYLSEMELSDCVSFILLSESLGAHWNSK